LRRLFSEASTKLKTRQLLFAPSSIIKPDKTENVSTGTEKKEKKEELYFKYIYHPKDISRLTIRSLYEQSCEKPSLISEGFKNYKITNDVSMKIDKLTIAYRRDENIRDRLIPSRLFEVPGREASTFLPIHSNYNPLQGSPELPAIIIISCLPGL